MSKNLLFYVSVLVLFGAGIFFTLDYGSSHLRTESSVQPAAPATAAEAQVKPAAEGAAAGGVLQGLLGNLKQPLSLLLLQVIVIAVAARSLGALFQRIRQPRVIGEMVAGILLGPSLLGWVAPVAQEFLFPASSMGPLRALSQIGVILFMFTVGIELDVQHLRKKTDSAVLVSHASIIVPFFLGTVFSLFLYRSLAPAGLHFSAFALFMGVSMSITAFPVLARILEERGLAKTFLGSTAIACAAVDDVTAWCLLAVVVAIVNSNGLGGSLVTIALSLLFIALMLAFVRPRIARAVEKWPHVRMGTGMLAAVFIFVFASALFTEAIGIHALFGAFLAGVCMPPDAGLREFLRARLETFSSVLLLPLFFAFTGLRTQIGLLNDWTGWLLCLAVIAVAITGKLGGSMAAARWTGLSWTDSFSLGVLMNTRGLVELIALNIGYDLGILSPRIFAMMVLMALITTFMTGPLLGLVQWGRRRETAAARTGAAA
ncbi:MAG TPA: cation:proton antiporter [Thermoanaerobaculia bacterium]|jgi:Kef-type K+ transport system membrane component KefB